MINDFFKINLRHPKHTVTDYDLVLDATLTKDYPNIMHILCAGHIEQNLQKNCYYLNAINQKELMEVILSLPFMEDKKDFDFKYTKIKENLTKSEFNKEKKDRKQILGITFSILKMIEKLTS